MSCRTMFTWLAYRKFVDQIFFTSAFPAVIFIGNFVYFSSNEFKVQCVIFGNHMVHTRLAL